MDRTERFYRIERLLRERAGVRLDEFIARLGVSRPTVVRDLAYLRDRMGVPIVFDRARGGYHLADARESMRHRLPGLWFNDDELRALRVAARLLAELDPGLLHAQLAPLEPRLRELLGEAEDPGSPDVLAARVRLFGGPAAALPQGLFATLAAALLRGRRLSLSLHEPSLARLFGREVSPQRLVLHDGRWYLDAWTHPDENPRSIPVAALEAIALADADALVQPVEALSRLFDDAYGPQAGPAAVDGESADGVVWVRLLFAAERAAAIARGHWHPRQRMRLLPSGELRLELPCDDPARWLGLALQHGRHCEVLGPPALRMLLADELTAIARRYAEVA